MRNLVWLACLALGATAAAAEPARPNVVVFLIDDMGVMDTSVPFLTDAEGRPQRHPLNDFYRTPNMERLANQGVRFSQFYAMSVCSPSRASLMTGQTSARHRTTQWINANTNNAGKFGPPDWRWSGLTAESDTLPRRLQKAGYRTIHCGKGHFGPFDTPGQDPRTIGFDVNIAGTSIGQPGSYYGEQNFTPPNPERKRHAVPGLEKYHGQKIFLTESLTLELNAAIGAAVQEQQPFFAYMSHYAVHGPHQPDPRFVGNYAGSKPNAAAFAGLIEGMDKSLGDVLDHLDKLGVAENTLVFFVGDNGTDAPLGPEHEVACAAPLRGKKGTHYEGGMRVPFIAAWAKPADTPLQRRTPIVAGSMRRDVGAIYDLFPTILAAAGEDASGAPDGVDLRPQFAGRDSTGAKSLAERGFLMHFPHEHRTSYFTVFRRGDWKLIYHHRRPLGERCEVFNLSLDPYEQQNVAASEPARRDELFAGMVAALKETGAQMPLDDDKKTPLTPTLNASK